MTQFVGPTAIRSGDSPASGRSSSISGGTGTFSGFEASVTVTASSTVTKGWNWDGTYSFDKAD